MWVGAVGASGARVLRDRSHNRRRGGRSPIDFHAFEAAGELGPARRDPLVARLAGLAITDRRHEPGRRPGRVNLAFCHRPGSKRPVRGDDRIQAVPVLVPEEVHQTGAFRRGRQSVVRSADEGERCLAEAIEDALKALSAQQEAAARERAALGTEILELRGQVDNRGGAIEAMDHVALMQARSYGLAVA